MTSAPRPSRSKGNTPLAHAVVPLNSESQEGSGPGPGEPAIPDAYLPAPYAEISQSGLKAVPRPGSGRRRKLEERIIVTATTLFADMGYAGVSIRELAKGAGVSQPVIYHFFDDKRDLYVECCLRLFAHNNNTLGEVVDALESPQEVIYGHTLCACYLHSNPRMSKLILRALLDIDQELITLLAAAAKAAGVSTKVAAALAQVLPEKDAWLTLISITSLVAGDILTAPLLLAAGDVVIGLSAPEQVASHVLSSLLPGTAWDEVANAVKPKLEAVMKTRFPL